MPIKRRVERALNMVSLAEYTTPTPAPEAR